MHREITDSSNTADIFHQDQDQMKVVQSECGSALISVKLILISRLKMTWKFWVSGSEGKTAVSQTGPRMKVKGKKKSGNWKTKTLIMKLVLGLFRATLCPDYVLISCVHLHKNPSWLNKLRSKLIWGTNCEQTQRSLMQKSPRNAGLGASDLSTC